MPDPDHPVYLANQDSERRTVRVWVERTSTGETVFEETRDVAAGTELEVYNLEQADPDGVERFTVCGRVVDSATSTGETPDGTNSDRVTECATVETSQCYGSIHVTVRGDTADVIYAVC